MHPWSLVVLAALGLNLLLERWLNARQMRAVLGHRDAVPEAFADRIPLEAHQKAADYTVARLRFADVEAIWSALLLLGWTFGGGLELLQGLIEGTGLGPLSGGVCFLLGFSIINAMLELPFSIWYTFRLEERFGFNRTTPKVFVSDLLKQLLLGIALGAPLAAVVLWLMASAGENWWLWAWLVWMGFSVLMMWAWPNWIAPLFNKFQPLEDEELKGRIERLLERCGFTSDGIFVMDGSLRSTHGNAYFAGLGRHKRIVFFDTLLQELEPDHIEAVLAHELGHFHHRHILKQMVFMALISLAGLWLLSWLMQHPWFYQGLGVSTPSAHAALALFMLLGPIFSPLLGPPMKALSRRFEFEADRFAARQARREALIEALLRLYRENASTLTPDPLYSAFHDSHPPAPIRIRRLLEARG